MGKTYIFNIQKFSVHDGDGIRSTVFFKGCPLKCLWCHNPESQRFENELLIYHDRCTACGICCGKCPNDANRIIDGKLVFDRNKCNACSICTDWCLNSAREIIGREYSVDYLVKEIEKDEMFYEESGGGVTLSGGEVMCQDMDYIEAVCKKLHKKGFSVDIDTCGFAPYESFKRILPYVDTFLYDIKLMDSKEHEKYIGVPNELILENLIKLNDDNAKINIRIPVIGKVNANAEFMESVVKFLKDNKINVCRVNLLPYHNIAMTKYNNLDRNYEEELMSVPCNDDMESYKQIFVSNGFNNVKIGG